MNAQQGWWGVHHDLICQCAVQVLVLVLITGCRGVSCRSATVVVCTSLGESPTENCNMPISVYKGVCLWKKRRKRLKLACRFWGISGRRWSCKVLFCLLILVPNCRPACESVAFTSDLQIEDDFSRRDAEGTFDCEPAVRTSNSHLAYYIFSTRIVCA